MMTSLGPKSLRDLDQYIQSMKNSGDPTEILRGIFHTTTDRTARMLIKDYLDYMDDYPNPGKDKWYAEPR